MKAFSFSRIAIYLALPFCAAAAAQAPQPHKDEMYFPAASTLTIADEYTRYELLAPGTGRFKIHYEVTVTTAGAKVFYNPIRKGSAASDESVHDAMTGKPLRFEIVNGAQVRQDPLLPDADPQAE